MSRLALGFLAAGLAACGDRTLGAPAPTALAPARGADSTAVAVTVSGDHFEPDVFADYGRASGSRLSVAFSARLETASGAQLPLQNVLWLGARTLTAVVPSTTPRGRYDLVITDPRGRSGRLADAFQVVSSAENVSGFLFDPIGPQTLGIPFLVGVTAIDQESAPVEGFDGTVSITPATGAFTPINFGPFVRGRVLGFLALDQLATGQALSALDALGHRGDSEHFDVVPGAPARVVFVNGPGTLAAGDCGGPFELESQDSLGKPAPAPAAVLVPVSAHPSEGAMFFADPGCVTPLSSARIEPGATRGTFFTRATHAGRAELRVAPTDLPSALQTLDVKPLAPTRLAFASPGASFKAGSCSPTVEIEAEDLYGNPSPAIATLPLTVGVEPPAGVSLSSDAQCANPLGALALTAGESSTRFNFRPTAPGTVKVRVQPADGGTFGLIEQSIEVLP